MVQIVDADFEAIGFEFVDEVARDSVIAFGDEIERGAEPELHFEFHQFAAFGEAIGSFDIVRYDESELFAIGPAGPACGWLFRARQDRPGAQDLLAFPYGEPAADGHAQRSRKEGLEAVVEAVSEHDFVVVKALKG